MIIDTHVHMGDKLNFHMPEEMVLEAMRKYRIDMIIASNCEAAECGTDQELLPPELQTGMYECTEHIIKFARGNPGKVFAAVWTKPRTEEPSADFRQLLKDNLDVVKAIKVHPYHSAVPFDDKRLEPYIQLAAEFHLPVVTHTGGCDQASPLRVFNAAEKYPDVNFVMVHMGLGSDNSEAIEMISRLPNLYGDTTWVPMKSALSLLEKTGSRRLLFGSDMPIDGVDTYHHNPNGDKSLYQDYFNELPKLISGQDYDNIMWKNAADLFNLPLPHAGK